jgi:hypothetical protein
MDGIEAALNVIEVKCRIDAIAEHPESRCAIHALEEIGAYALEVIESLSLESAVQEAAKDGAD